VSILRGRERRSGGVGVLLSQAAIPPPGFFYPTDAGPTVNTDSAMRLAAVWAAVNLLTDIVAPLPWHTYEQTATGQLKRVPDPKFISDPSNETSISAADWRAQVMRSLLLRGNAYGLIKEVSPFGEPATVQIIHPDYVSVVRLGPLGPFEFRVLGEKKELYPAGDLIHIPAYTVPGSPVGLSPIDYARQAIGLGLASEEFGARWFGDGAHPSAVLATDQPVTSEQAHAVKQRFNEAIRGRREVAVLGAGLEYQQIQVSANESQFLDTIKANATTVARFFGLGMAPEMIGAESGNSMTYVNVEQRSLNLLTYAGRPWINRLEVAMSGFLRRNLIVKADTDELLRTDAKTRVDIQAQRLRMGVRSVDETRAEDNMPPLPNGEGQEYLWPPFATQDQATAPVSAPPQIDNGMGA